MRLLNLTLLGSACWASCYPPAACIRFDPKTTVAFIGVAGQATLLSTETFHRRARVHFRVEEILYGLAPGTRDVVVLVDQWPSETPTESLIVQAERRNGEIEVHGCETSLYSVNGRPDDLDYYRQLRAGTYRPTLKVVLAGRGSAAKAGAQLTLTRPGFERVWISGEWGVAELKDLTPAKYRLTTRQKDFLPPPDQEVTITADRCAQAKVELTASSSVTGRALDPRGLPIPGLVVDLVSTDNGQSAMTDAAGRFRFTGVPPGVHSLATQVNMGPDTLVDKIATPRCQQQGAFWVNAFQNVTGVEFRCPGLGALRAIRVRVVSRANGRPVAEAEVRSPPNSPEDPSYVDIPYGLKTDVQGWARISAMDGAWLQVQAIAPDGRASQVVKVNRFTGDQVLLLKL